MKSEDVLNVQINTGQTGNRGILLRFLPTCYCFILRNWRPMQSEKSHLLF